MTRKSSFKKIIPGLEDVALIDAKACASAGDVGLTWWHEAVRQGIAPRPIIRTHRFSRWRLSEVREFWSGIASDLTDFEDRTVIRSKTSKNSGEPQ